MNTLLNQTALYFLNKDFLSFSILFIQTLASIIYGSFIITYTAVLKQIKYDYGNTERSANSLNAAFQKTF